MRAQLCILCLALTTSALAQNTQLGSVSGEGFAFGSFGMAALFTLNATQTSRAPVGFFNADFQAIPTSNRSAVFRSTSLSSLVIDRATATLRGRATYQLEHTTTVHTGRFTLTVTDVVAADRRTATRADLFHLIFVSDSGLVVSIEDGIVAYGDVAVKRR